MHFQKLSYFMSWRKIRVFGNIWQQDYKINKELFKFAHSNPTLSHT